MTGAGWIAIAAPMSLPSGVRALGLVASLALGSMGCGGESLTRPTDLPITVYPAGSDFTLTLVMKRCRQTCETYSEASCDVSIEEDDRIVRVSPEVSVETNGDERCDPSCGGAPVLVHCRVSALAPGEWTVESSEGRFRRVITLR